LKKNSKNKKSPILDKLFKVSIFLIQKHSECHNLLSQNDRNNENMKRKSINDPEVFSTLTVFVKGKREEHISCSVCVLGHAILP
jgi:hypothetical protein